MNNKLALLQPDNPFYAERKDAALLGAHQNALRRLVRCLFAEKIISKDLLMFAPRGRSAWLPLWRKQAQVFFDDLMVVPANTFASHGAITLVELGNVRTPITTADQLIDLLQECFDLPVPAEGIAGLKKDIANSVENDMLARIHRDAWNTDLRARMQATGSRNFIHYLRAGCSTKDAAVLLDQWGALEGHPFYPTWKSKPGLGPDEVAQLSPEFEARVKVRVASLRADMAYIEKMPHVRSYHAWFAAQFPLLWQSWKAQLNARQLNEQDWLPLPLHSWHLEHYVQKEYAAEIRNGILIIDGPELITIPTMSFRTMMPDQVDCAPFIKLPVALWLTSEQRSLQAKSIHMGPRISAVVQHILADENGFDKTLEIFPEEVALHYRNALTQDDRPGRYLSVAFRASKAAFERTDGLLPVIVASLFTPSPSSHRPLVTELIEQDGIRASAGAVEAFFRQYARTVTHPVVSIYLLYGIGLEAHQQNTTVLFSADGMPRSILVRDFGDGRTYLPLLSERGYTLAPYIYKGILPTVFTDDIEPVRSYVLDACFVCHLHELALLLTREYDLDSHRLWDILREETQAAFDAVAPRMQSQTLWQTERAAFLDTPWPTRSVLKMHLLQYSDYRLQHQLPNPLVRVPG